MTSSPQKSLYTQIPGRSIPLGDSTEVPVCTPEFRKSNGSYLKKRGLYLLNRFLRKGCFETVGSPWLPGFWILSASEAASLVRSKGLRANSLNVVITSAPVVDQNWRSFKGEPLMVIENVWSSFEEYAVSMKKKYRQRLRKALQLDSVLEKRWLDAAHYEDCAALLEATLMDKVVVLPGDLTLLLERFEGMFETDFQIEGFYDQGRLVAFISTVRDGDTLRAMHYGAAVDAPANMYSFAMFSVIQRGIEAGVSKINLGRTATEIKSTYGAVPEHNYFSFYTESVLFKSALAVAARRYTPKDFELRSPFKDE